MEAHAAAASAPDVEAGGDAHRRVEKAVLLSFVSLRGLHLAQAALSTATAWRTYRRPRLAAAALGLSTVESVWLAYRGWNREAMDDPTSAWIDTGLGMTGLVALCAATTDADRTTWMNWMLPVTLDSAIVAATNLGRRRGAAAVTGLAGTYLATMKDSLTVDRTLVTAVVASALGYPGDFLAADRFVRHLRRSADEIERTRRDAVERGERLAIERERSRQHRRFNRSALDTLAVIAQGWDRDRDGQVRARVRREAARLRSALRGGDGDGDGNAEESLAFALEELAQDFAAEGLGVELVLGELHAEPTADRAGALRDATSEALRNVVRHGGVSSVVVRACSESEHVEVTVRDHGVGCETEQLATGAGIATRIVGPLHDVGGSADVHSSPGRGTRIVLRVPR